MRLRKKAQPLIMLALINLGGCTNQTPIGYVLEISGHPETRCKIWNDQRMIGTFTVPSIVELGSKIGEIEADCAIDDRNITSTIESADAQCQDQIVVKSLCPKLSKTVELVEISVKRSQ